MAFPTDDEQTGRARQQSANPLVSPWAARRIAERSTFSRVRTALFTGALVLGAHGGLAIATATPAGATYVNDIDHDGVPNATDPDVDGDGIPNGTDPDVDRKSHV